MDIKHPHELICQVATATRLHMDLAQVDRLRGELDEEMSGGNGNGNGNRYLSHQFLPFEQRDDGCPINGDYDGADEACKGKGKAKCKMNYNSNYEVLPFEQHQSNQRDECEDDE